MATPDFSQYPYFFQQQHRVESTPMSARNLRPARSFRSRAKAHGIRNVPPTPSLSHGGRDVTFDFEKNGGEEEGGTAEAAPVLWVKCRVSSVSSSIEAGGDLLGGDLEGDSGFHYRPGRLLGKGRRPKTFSFQVDGEDTPIEIGSDSIGPPVDAEFTPMANMVDIVNVHEVSGFGRVL